MASLSSQLQAIKSVLNVSSDPEPGKRRPLTRPSILFDAKGAADIDVDTIFNIALSGLEVLIGVDERFRNHKSVLFSYQSKELDRELVGQEENTRINVSISSYLRLLSGYLELHSALKTLEYLIRRYKVHIYNVEDLILCAMPYHDTHTFVKVVQLINTGNSKWSFLDGVKKSGARLPREVIVQQCIRDMGVLESICNYATPADKIQPSNPVIGFCTAVIFEVLGRITIDSNIVKRILPYVSSGLQAGAKGLNQKAGALMIVNLLGQKSVLAPKVVKSLLHSVADIARAESKEGGDLKWLRMSFMTVITLVQIQSVELIPKKTVDLISEIREFSTTLLELNKEFNIDKFLAVFLDSLLEYSVSDDLSLRSLLAIIESVPVKEHISRIVSRLLAKKNPGKQLLVSIFEKYPNESRAAFYSFMESAKVSPSYDLLCKIFDGNLDTSQEISDPKLYFALEHSEADIRKLAVSGLDVTKILEEKAVGSKKFDAIQDALLRRLYDDDLNVVLAVLKLKNMPEILNSPLLIDALQQVLQRCTDALLSSSTTNTSRHGNVALSCLQEVFSVFKDQEQFALVLATSIFPLLLVQPKTQRSNLKALELAKDSKWPYYENLVLPSGPEKKMDLSHISSINIENISNLADKFSSCPEKSMEWFTRCCNSHELSKTFFFLVLWESLKMLKMDDGQFCAFFDSCFPILKNEWEMLESLGVVSADLCKKRIQDGDCKGILEHLLDTNLNVLNAEILACLFWSLLEVFIATVPEDKTLELFSFFACHSKDVFEKHLEYLSTKCKDSMMRVLLKQFIDEGVPDAVRIESLHAFSHVCSLLDDGSALLFLNDNYPSMLVPLSSDSQNIRVAAMSCIEKLLSLWSHIGNKEVQFQLLRSIVQQKKMILSDKNVLTSFFTSLFSSSDSLLVQQAVGKRFDASTKDNILVSLVNNALKLPAHAKLNILSLIRGVGSKLLSVSGARSLLSDLLECSHQYHFADGNVHQKLSESEVEILCLLLECCTKSTSSHDFGDFIVKALQVNGAEDSAVVKPCMSVLENLTTAVYGNMNTETQELIFRNLLVLFRNAIGDVQNSARDTLLRIKLDTAMLEKVLDSILDNKTSVSGSAHAKKQKKSVKCQDALPVRQNNLSMLSVFLDVLLMKKNMENRASLVGPLFKLLHRVFMDDEWSTESSDTDSRTYIQQTLLLTLEDISSSIVNAKPQEDTISNFDLRLLVNCARSSDNAVTRNHAFSLITTLVKIVPEEVLNQVLDILTAIGESTVTQWDSYSQRVFEGLVSAIIPCWLCKTNDTDQLLQIFVNILPEIAEHRRLLIIKHILSALGEGESLGSLLFLLFHSLVSKENLNNAQAFGQLIPIINKQWEYEFAMQLSEQYSCKIWLPSLILLLQKIGTNTMSEGPSMQTLVAMQFVADKLNDPEISYKLESANDDLNHIQNIVGELMEQVVYHLQLVDLKKKRLSIPAALKGELKEFMHVVVETLTRGLQPSTYFDVINKLISHNDKNVRKKALGLLCAAVKNLGTNPKLEKKGSVSRSMSKWLHLDETSLKSFENLCLEILKLLDTSDDVSSISLKLAAVSALDVLANKFPSHDSVFNTCLGSVCRCIDSDNSALSSHCLRATAALVNALGPKALRELPTVMQCLLRKSSDSSNSVDSLLMSILLTLEAVVNTFAGFLNPYMGDILRLVLLHQPLFSLTDPKLKLKADTVRKLITEKIPVRLLLPPLLSMYSEAINSGQSSVSVVFEMIGNLIGTMDRSSIAAYHAKVFDLCLLALDLRHQNLTTVQNIDGVEENVISAIVTLTMKLTETMFRPLFVKTIEWSGLNIEGAENTLEKLNSRAISFYRLVNKLAESHRSLFVPYFKYLLDGFVRGLVESDYSKPVPEQKKKKKAKLSSNTNDGDGNLSVQVWHLRSLILSSLHKCFIYDSGSTKFLNSANFEALMKPVVSQLSVDPPESLENHPSVPSVNEVDDMLVATVGQMAVTAASDVLWKPLNHEVLMQTRKEKIRPRILGLRVIKYLLDNLKEEYLVFLPETIPFLAELLEDMDPQVKSLAQSIGKEMETLSGETLADYL